MRPISILTALTVATMLYLLVMEREAVLIFSGATTQEEDRHVPPAANSVSVLESELRTMRVEVMHSVAQTVDNAILLRGETRALRQVEVRAETTAAVISEPLRKGAMVRAGDVLCRLDPGTREEDLARARAALVEAEGKIAAGEARLAEANARFNEAQITYNATSKLREEGFASQTRLVSARAALRSAETAIASAKSGLEGTRAEIESAAASVAQATREIERLTIKAPFRGLLESDAAELGSLLQPGSLCATVIQLDQIKLIGYVPEPHISRIANGVDATARLATGQQVRGTVSYISRSADPATRTFEVEILVDNADLAIRDGQTAEIAIAAPGAKAHKLPQSALVLNNEGELGVRTVDADNIVRFVSVTILRDTPSGVWLNGLPNVANIIVIGQDFVTHGVKVTPAYRETTQ